MLERLPFQLPEFFRVAWASESARAYWEPKIHAITQVWPVVERASVYEGLRKGTLQSVEPAQLPALQVECFERNMLMTVVGIEGVSPAGNASVSYQSGKPCIFRVYIGGWPKSFLAAWTAGDTRVIGERLGFPDCCVQFFERYWQRDGWRDLTYPMLESEHVNQITNNVLLRALGVRPVFHLPCAFTCEPSREIGEQVLALMVLLGHTQEEAWLRALLSMPMEWSSLHGVAMVITPIFKLVYDSDPLPTKVTLRLPSDAYPMYGARGNVFPFEDQTPVPVPLRLKRPPYLNGFTSLAAMERGHRFILDALPGLTGGVVDLGCGDGTLMRAIQQKYPDTTVHGVESQADLADGNPRIIVADLFGWPWGGDYQCVLLAVQRLMEVNRTAAVELLAEIRRHSAMVLLYSYDGPHPEIEPLLTPFRIIAAHADGTHAAFLME